MSERGYKLGHFVEIGDLHWGSQTQFTVAWGDAVLDGPKGWLVVVVVVVIFNVYFRLP